MRFLQPFSLYFWGQKYQKPPHVVLRGRIRPATLPGARKIGAYAPPRDCRAACRTLFFRFERECGFIVPPLAASLTLIYGYMPLLFPLQKWASFSRKADPRLGSDGEKADGRLKAQAAGTVCLQTREQSPDAAFRCPDAAIGIGRVAFAAFRHRKAGKKAVKKKWRGADNR